IMSAEPSWQKLRLVYEGICGLLGGERELRDARYLSTTEQKQFKANCHDPRLSGQEALHIEPWGGPIETPMSLTEGRQLMARLLNKYLTDQQTHQDSNVAGNQ